MELVKENINQKKQTAKAPGTPGAAPGTFFSPAPLQAKLTIGSTDDPLEREADDMAERVMRMPAGGQPPFFPAPPVIQRNCSGCKEEEQVQRKPGKHEGSLEAPPVVHDVINSAGGRPLDGTTRLFMEARFANNFGDVRIHDHPAAAKSADAINALAYTSGKNIVFNAGQYKPGTSGGKKLLAHELTHVVQQAKGASRKIRRRTAVSDYVTAAYLPGPLWDVHLVITNAPAGETEAFLDFEDACMDGIRGAARALGNGRSALSHRVRVRMRYQRGFDFVTIENEAYRQALASVLPPPAPAPTVVPPAPAPVTTPAPAPVVTTSRAGAVFDQFVSRITLLETAAISDGYSLTDRITAFRKIYYNSGGPAQTYAGSAVGGGAFNILIPGAAATQFPPAWSSQQNLIDAVTWLRANPSIDVQPLGNVDVGHLFAGLDAGLHPASITLALGSVRFRSNKEAATFMGDLGSVVVEYIIANTASFRDVAMVRNNTILNAQYTRMASNPDMAGNVDSYALVLNTSRTVAQNLVDYYTPASGGLNWRYTDFANAIGLGALNAGRFAGDTPALRSALRDEVFNTALAYAAANGRRGDVINVFNDPGPGVFVPTYWEMYFNISGWVVDKFITSLMAQVAAE